MAEITLTADEITRLENKLEAERSTMPDDEASMIKGILGMAKDAQQAQTTSDPNWIFGWTYKH